jgi:hypothetical protein
MLPAHSPFMMLIQVPEKAIYYLLPFLLADLLFHAVQQGPEVMIQRFFFAKGMRQRINEDERNILQVIPAAGLAKKVFQQGSITFVHGLEQVFEIRMHQGKGRGTVSKRNVSLFIPACLYKCLTDGGCGWH